MLDRVTIERMGRVSREPIVIALSGGGDSTALVFLLGETFERARLRAVVVDHGLREGSAEDAARTARYARRLGVHSEVHTLTWPDGPRRAQQAAREARYRALCGAARKHGAHVVAVAHTADDQAETVLMRAASGSSWRGLAGMAAIAPAPVWPEGRGIVLARPLLNTRGEHLRETLRKRGASWIEDPANANVAFERVRVRQRLAALEQEGFDPMRLVRLAADLRIRVDAVDREARGLIASAARFEDDRIVLGSGVKGAGVEVRRRVLSVLLTAAAGAPREPGVDAVARVDEQVAAADFRGATLGGARISLRRGDLVLSRDAGALEGRADGAAPIAALTLEEGVETVWDGRLALTMPEAGWRVTVQDGAPQLVRGEERAPFGIASPRWLLQDRVEYLLGA